MKHKIILNKEIRGTILDIGGGGEGIIGRLYEDKVVAIDNLIDELNETKGNFKKIMMDARDLKFSDESFDNVTFFYSLLYMEKEIQELALKEALRVLKKGGNLYIWDIDSNIKEGLVIADLNIIFNEEEVNTTYGSYRVTSNSKDYILNIFFKDEKNINVKISEDNHYFIKITK